jgi:hypothetical protein
MNDLSSSFCIDWENPVQLDDKAVANDAAPIAANIRLNICFTREEPLARLQLDFSPLEFQFLTWIQIILKAAMSYLAQSIPGGFGMCQITN